MNETLNSMQEGHLLKILLQVFLEDNPAELGKFPDSSLFAARAVSSELRKLFLEPLASRVMARIISGRDPRYSEEQIIGFMASFCQKTSSQ